MVNDYYVDKVEVMGAYPYDENAAVLMYYRKSKNHKRGNVKILSDGLAEEFLFWHYLDKQMSTLDFKEEKNQVINQALGYIKRADNRLK